ncbi:hypothetical protein B0T17DRAFT_545151, partial [Bombardia bombarda]
MLSQTKDSNKKSKLLADFGSNIQAQKIKKADISHFLHLHGPQTTHSTISKDKTKGEAAYRANLLAYFGKKLQRTPITNQDSNNGEIRYRIKTAQGLLDRLHALTEEEDTRNDEARNSYDFETYRMIVESKAQDVCGKWCEDKSKEIRNLHISTAGRRIRFEDWDQMVEILEHVFNHKAYNEYIRKSTDSYKMRSALLIVCKRYCLDGLSTYITRV